MADRTRSSALDGRRIVFLAAAEGVEQTELTEPWAAVSDAGGAPILVSEQPGTIEAFHQLDRADTFPVEGIIGEMHPDHHDALVLPGGLASPDFLRTVPNAVRLVGEFARGPRREQGTSA